MNWFTTLTGLGETTREKLQGEITIADEEMIINHSGKRLHHGRLEVPQLAELRKRSFVDHPAPTRVRQLVADVQDLHRDPVNAGALFQVASQFNLLEMVGPSVTPECGVSGYENDRTQGPACAIAAGAGTIYRNYFVPIENQIGQTAETQIDCLEDLGKLLGNDRHAYWTMRNGYALPSSTGLETIDRTLEEANESERDLLRASLRIGVQSNTAVTISNAKHLVSQAYCSALPVAYSHLCPTRWENFARLVLEAAYEATLAAGVLNALETGNPTVYLTLLGGGAFGNETTWILDAIQRAGACFANADLDVAIVSYGYRDESVDAMIRSMELAP